MRYLAPLVLAAVMSVTSLPSEAAPQWIEKACFYEASQMSFNGRGEQEQFMTNCIDDLIVMPLRERLRERRKYRLRYGY